MSVNRLLSVCTITTVGLLCKAFLNLGFCKSVTVSGLHHLLDALNDNERNSGRGVVTVANHISTLDDPVTWGVLPARCYINLHNMRWALGASDIMFTNPAFSAFFRHGQVLETFRGNGIYQTSVDTAIEKLNEGGWVHLFGEGKVNQPCQYPLNKDETGKEIATLPRFKWGIGRILMEAQSFPVVIPMWLSGFEDVMPEPRPAGFPANFLPHLRQSLRITFAPPVDLARFASALKSSSPQNPKRPLPLDGSIEDGAEGETVVKKWLYSVLTAAVQREVERVGYVTSGPLLGRPQNPSLS